MRKMFTVGLAAVMAMGLCACGSQKAAETTAAPAAAETTAAPSQDEKKEEAEETTEAQASSETAGGEGYVVALCNYSIGNSWRAQMEQEFVAEAEKLKAEGVVSEYYITNSNEDINKQISDMQDLITKKVDAIVITAASPTALAPVVEEATEAGIKVVSFDNVVETDEQVATVGIDEKLKAEGVVSEYYITNSNEDINKQISDMQDLITKKVDAIVITAASPTALAPVVEEAAEAGIKVVSFDNVVETDEQVATVGIDEKEFGRIGAEWLVDKLDGKGKIVVLNGIAGTATDSLRWGGAEEVFKQYPDIEILGSANASWDYAQGKAAMESMLSAYPEIDGVWSQGGAMTQGAIDAFIAAGRDLVPMTSEGNNGAIRAWIENKDKGLSCIAPSNPTYTSAEALRVVIKALNGEDIPGNVVMDIETVTEENVDQYYRSDMPDSFWVLTELDDATLQKLYK